jgi:hypothetical protein
LFYPLECRAFLGLRSYLKAKNENNSFSERKKEDKVVL